MLDNTKRQTLLGLLALAALSGFFSLVIPVSYTHLTLPTSDLV